MFATYSPPRILISKLDNHSTDAATSNHLYLNKNFISKICGFSDWLRLIELLPGMWKWKRLNFCGSGSTLKKEAGRGSKLGSIWLFKEPEAEAFFIKHGAGMRKRKRLNFCGSGSTLKEAENGSKLGSDKLYTELEAEAKNILQLLHPWTNFLIVLQQKMYRNSN